MKVSLCAAAAAAMVTTLATAAVADDWDARRFPYAREHHERCQAASRRLHEVEHEAAEHEHRRHELREEIEQLRHELDHDCGGWRWR